MFSWIRRIILFKQLQRLKNNLKSYSGFRFWKSAVFLTLDGNEQKFDVFDVLKSSPTKKLFWTENCPEHSKMLMELFYLDRETHKNSIFIEK